MNNQIEFPCKWGTCECVLRNTEDFLSHLDGHLTSAPWRCCWRGCIHKTTCDHRSNLFQHVLMHTNYRPFKCSVPACNYAAPFSWSLRRHTEAHARTGILYGPVPTRRKAVAAAQATAAVMAQHGIDPVQSQQIFYQQIQKQALVRGLPVVPMLPTINRARSANPKVKRARYSSKCQKQALNQSSPKISSEAIMSTTFPNALPRILAKPKQEEQVQQSTHNLPSLFEIVNPALLNKTILEPEPKERTSLTPLHSLMNHNITSAAVSPGGFSLSAPLSSVFLSSMMCGPNGIMQFQPQNFCFAPQREELSGKENKSGQILEQKQSAFEILSK